MEKIAARTPDLVQANIDAIAELFPDVLTEALDAEGNVTRAIDFDALRQELSDHVVDGPRERYLLDWPGKNAARLAANAPTRSTLRPVLEDSVDFDNTRNLFIEGDNLEALKILQESYLGKVKLIYIDPPYNTGNDFIYDDDFAETTVEFLARSGQVDEDGTKLTTNTESNGRFHSDWLSMMYPRLKLARNLLADDGAIFVSIDDNEVAQLTNLLTSIFGAQNFLGNFVWTTKNAARGVPPRTMLMSNHEYVVAFARDISKFSFHGLERDENDFSNPDNDPRGLWRSESMKATGSQNNRFAIVDPKTGWEFHANWAFSSESMARMISEGLVIFPDSASGTPRQKKFMDSYVNERKAFVTQLGWFSTESATKAVMGLFDEQKVFDFPKPLPLIEFLVRQASSGDDLVMDFFAGSGTTGHAVMACNAADGGGRRYLLVQVAEPCLDGSDAARAGFDTIASLSRERIRRAAGAIVKQSDLASMDLDIGFRCLRVDSGSFGDVLRNPEGTEQISLDSLADNTKKDRADDDLLFQVMVDWGLDLSAPIASEGLGGYNVFNVDNGGLIACFSQSVSPEVVRGIALRSPLRVVFRDSSFDSDADRINVEQIFRELSPDTQVKVI